jgi:hypothetical protein
MLQIILYGRIYAPKHLALAEMYAGHLQRRCSAVSRSPQFGQLGLIDKPIVCRWLLRAQCPVRMLVILFKFLRVSEVKYLACLLFILMQFLACLACGRESQCFWSSFDFQFVMSLLNSDEGALMPGSGPISGKLAPTFARLSEISFPKRLL